jgi:hypothetical protein
MNNNQMKLVPIQPTHEMLLAAIGWRETDSNDELPLEVQVFERVYRTMLSAAPSLPPVSDGNSEAVAFYLKNDELNEKAGPFYIDKSQKCPSKMNWAAGFKCHLLYERQPTDLTASLQAENKRLLEALKKADEAMSTCECSPPNYMAMAGREYYFDSVKINEARSHIYALITDIERKGV